MRLNEELNYKQVCAELNDKPVQGGDHRKRQLAQWNKLAEVEKIGRGKYIIHRELSIKEIQDNEDTENYTRFLQSMLLELFSKQDAITHTYTYRELREYLSMVNRHYFPVKYGDEDIDIKTQCTINISDVVNEGDNFDLVLQERSWFQIADSFDKYALHYAIKSLKARGLLADYRLTYEFYKKNRGEHGEEVYSKPVVATDEQFAEIHQRNMDFLKKHLTRKQIEEINEASKKEQDKIYGRYEQAVFRQGEKARKAFGDIPRAYAEELGYTGYAKAITIVKPTRLETLVKAFAPRFNKAQVKRYLESKRFKEIPMELHQQLTDKLIKR